MYNINPEITSHLPVLVQDNPALLVHSAVAVAEMERHVMLARDWGIVMSVRSVRRGRGKDIMFVGMV